MRAEPWTHRTPPSLKLALEQLLDDYVRELRLIICPKRTTCSLG
ncbi:MAG: hypothetical protein AABM42_07055 [Actinomycetota bacterium]